MTYKTEWIAEDKQRVIDMDRWYRLDKRHLPSHKYHSLFTGLGAIGHRLDKKNELETRMSNAYDKLKKCK
jgi:hypothetical protein